MGRKKDNKVREHKNSQLKKRELNAYVNQLMEALQEMHPSDRTLTPAENWDNYLKVEAIVRQIIGTESAIYKANDAPHRRANIDNFLKWLRDNGAVFEGIEIAEFEGYDLGLKATKDFDEGSLMLVMPRHLMMSQIHAKESELGKLLSADPNMKDMNHVTLALYLLCEKFKPDSFWKPYIDVLPQKHSTILYYSTEDIASLKPSPALEMATKMYRSIARQYAYFYTLINTKTLPITLELRKFFTFENYRWAVSTVMTRQNSIQYKGRDLAVFIPFWDMCNHKHGQITTDFNQELDRVECYSLGDYKKDDQIFIYYGARSNGHYFIHNGFVYPDNRNDSLSLSLGISLRDPLAALRLELLGKLGLDKVHSYIVYREDPLLSPEIMVFARVFCMNEEELRKWLCQVLPADLVVLESGDTNCVGLSLDSKAYNYILTRCRLLHAAYRPDQRNNESFFKRNIRMLKECELKILDNAIVQLTDQLEKLGINASTSVTTSAATNASTSVTTSAATSVATSAATSVATSAATGVTTSAATSVATSVTTSAATSVATSAATGVTTSAATSVATSAATGVPTSAATSVTTSVTTSAATSVATSVTTSAATSVATSAATGVTTSAATSVATSAATGVTTSAATSVATSVTTSAATSVATSVTTSAATSASTSAATSATTKTTTGATRKPKNKKTKATGHNQKSV